MFYNEEVKIQFINDYKRSRVVNETSLTGMFNKIYKYEIQNKKDCNNFAIEEILAMYRCFKAKSVHVLENYNVYLKAMQRFVCIMVLAWKTITQILVRPCCKNVLMKI